MKNKYNGLAKWFIVALAIGTIAYNSIVTHVIMKNDLKHFEKRLIKIEQKFERLYDYLLKAD